MEVMGQSFYRSYTDFLKDKFGGRVQKLSINAGRTCPNRDGTKGVDGCIYCLNEAFTPSYCTSDKSIIQQIEEGIEFHTKRYRRAVSYVAYFQSYTNTYAEAEELKKSFELVLQHPEIVGISIGTRPDCIDEQVVKLLYDLAQSKFVKVELGVESVFDETLECIHRGHTMQDTLNALQILKKNKIPTGAHIILGLPGEGRSEIQKTAQILSQLGFFSVKLHQLQIFRNTPLEKMYIESPSTIPLFELSEYIDVVIDFAEQLDPNMYIERFAGEVPPRYLVAPDWGMIRYDQVLQLIIKRFEERGTRQGIKKASSIS
jgi:uncharacterized protein